MFIFVKLFHCIDVSNKTVNVDAVNENGIITSNTSESTDSFDQTTISEPLENGDAMQMCNQTFPTPKGTVCIHIGKISVRKCGFLQQQKRATPNKQTTQKIINKVVLLHEGKVSN